MLQRALRFVIPAAAVCLVIGSILTADRLASAQQGRAPVPAGSLPPGASDAARFTGTSRSLEPGNLRISHRWFEPGARTAWHRHAEGQLLFVEKGSARTQQRGGPLKELAVGDSDYTAPNVDHWHGAAPNQEFYQVAVGFGEATEWLEKVGDEQYAGR
jgi:quercetin dioxygenase-like cupin family protein